MERPIRTVRRRVAVNLGRARAFWSFWRELDVVERPTQIGRGTYFDGKPTVVRFDGDTGRVEIGAFCSVGRGVTFLVGGNHATGSVTTYPIRGVFGLPEGTPASGKGTRGGDIIVGSDVWIGRGVTILSGVHVGNGAVLGAEAVITKSVRPYAIVAGNPGREIRRRFSDEQVDALESIAWWEWRTEQVVASVEELCSDDVDAFIRAHGGSRT